VQAINYQEAEAPPLPCVGQREGAGSSDSALVTKVQPTADGAPVFADVNQVELWLAKIEVRGMAHFCL